MKTHNNPKPEAKTARRSGGWLRRLVRCHGHRLNPIYSVLVQWSETSNLALERSVNHLLDNSIPNLCLWTLSSATPSCLWRQRTLYKKIPAWSCGDTVQISRLENTHPENGGDASWHPPTPAQPTESSEQREYKETMKLESMQSSLRTITNIVWMILGLQIMKEVNPTMSLWLRLPIASALSSLLTSLLPICESRLLHLWRSDSCDKEKRVAMTPNEKS